MIYDPVGGDVFDGSTKCLAFEGRLLTIGFAGGRIPTLAVNRVLLKNISVVGVHWGYYRRRGSPLVQEWMDALLKLYDEGRIRPVIYRTYPLREAAPALAGAGVPRVLRKGGPAAMTSPPERRGSSPRESLPSTGGTASSSAAASSGPARSRSSAARPRRSRRGPSSPASGWSTARRACREPGRRLTNRIENFYPYHPGFKAIFDGDKLLGRVSDLLGEPAVLFKDKINFKLAGGDGFKPHQDQQAGWSVYASLFVTALVAIDDATEANGCLELAAGHHTRGLIGPEWAPLSEAGPPGSRVRLLPHPAGRRGLLRFLRPPPLGPEPLRRAPARPLRHLQPPRRGRPSGAVLRGQAEELPA